MRSSRAKSLGAEPTVGVVPVEQSWLAPDWRVTGVGALMTTRHGGVSGGPFASMNIGDAVGDDPTAVGANRTRLAAALTGAVPVYLRQVHGTRVVRLFGGASSHDVPVEADASITTDRGVCCVIQTADCLPVLMAADDASVVGAAHAGWRGLAAGVLEATVTAMCRAAGCPPAAIRAWLGPCIGPAAFEVGSDVLQAFTAGEQPAARASSSCFMRRGGAVADGEKRTTWLADLSGLARLRLAAAGVLTVTGGALCTVSDASRFFSFRRDRVTGRMAAAVWLEGG